MKHLGTDNFAESNVSFKTGTWTPAAVVGAGSIASYGSRSAFLTRIGNLAHVTFSIEMTAGVSGASLVGISGGFPAIDGGKYFDENVLIGFFLDSDGGETREISAQDGSTSLGISKNLLPNQFVRFTGQATYVTSETT